MELIIIRHAYAENVGRDGTDASRPLSERGLKQADRVGQSLLDRVLIPDILLVSPYLRAQQTAERMVAVGGAAEVITAPFLASGMSVETALSELATYREFKRIALVGHEPDLSGLICKLIGASAWAVEMNPATVAQLEVNASLTAAALRSLNGH